MSRRLHELPTEIIRMICQHIAREDLGNFRKTSVRLAANGNDYLFEHGKLRLYLHRAFFDRFQQISRLPIPCKHIKILEIIGTEDDLESFGLDPEARDGGDDRLYPQQEFKECVLQLTNMYTVVLRVTTMKQLPDLLDRDFNPVLLKQMNWLSHDIQACSLPNLRGIESIDLPWQSPSSDKAKENAGRLRSVFLYFRTTNYASPSLQVEHAVDFLVYTQNLQYLMLGFGGLQMYNRHEERSFDRICRLRFPRLRNLSLVNGNVDHASLLIFLLSHCARLDELAVQSLDLRGGTWENMITILSTQLFRFRAILFRGHLTDPSLLEKDSYLCGRRLTPRAVDCVIRHQGPLVIDACMVAARIGTREGSCQGAARCSLQLM
ncbi:hypothetical protein ACLMJK_005361 [Lecanora helva]